MNAGGLLSTVTVAELRRIRDAPDGETLDEDSNGEDSESDTLPQTPGDGGLTDRLSQALAAKLAGREPEPVLLGDYELERLIGVGGMGQVFAARSRSSGRQVALKLLRRASARGLLSLKREFRVLAEFVHPNLVGLDALVVGAETDSFFTMELVRGVPFVEYVRSGARRRAPVDGARLRAALLQLVEAIEHLHARGYVHRDLKPSNVLVTAAGRVVVLDFGLVDECDLARKPDETQVIGTPAYMAPEQIRLEAAAAPVDLYAIGTILFECLCGERPFAGTMTQVLLAKLEGEIPDPSERVDECDPELRALCGELLARDPQQRPSAQAVRERLRGQSTATARPQLPFVGREAELATLDRALLESSPGRAQVCMVGGPSGQGKSSLLARWQSRLDGDQLILRGRCLERESVAYKGLDAIIDALSAQLARLSASELAVLRPPHLAEVVRLFPVLAAVWPDHDEPSAAGLQPVERRERAISGLRELLARLARMRRVVIMLDDYHWADTDSSVLVEQLLDSVIGPPLSLLVGYRQPPDPGPAVAQLRALRASPHVELHELELGPLTPDDARTLVATLLGPSGKESSEGHAEAILREGAGHPASLRALTREHDGAEVFDLDRLLARRVQGLTPLRRDALILVALAEGPIQREALGAAGCDLSDLEALIGAGLLRISDLDGEQVELEHERLAALTVAELEAAERRRGHLRLAAALADIAASPELLAKHYERGDAPSEALVHAQRAAAQAMDAFAFRRAATWLERCLAWLPEDHEPGLRHELELQLVSAYANSGRLVAGADLLLAQARERVHEARRLRLQAVEYLLRAGRMRDGLREARELLDAVGLALPRGRSRMLLNVLGFRRRLAHDLARLAARGEAAKPNPEPDPELRERARVCEAMARGFLSHDGLVALHFSILWRGLAIDIGDRDGCARAMAIDATFCSSAGWLEQIPALLEPARALVPHNPHIRLWLFALETHIGLNLGEFRETLARFEAALPEFESNPDRRWERHLATGAAALTMVFAGHYHDAIALARRELHIALELGDLKQTRDNAGFLSLALVYRGELDEAARLLADIEGIERGAGEGHYTFGRLFLDFARIRRLLRTGAAREALALALTLPAKMKRDGLWHVVSFRLEALAVIAVAELQLWLPAPSWRGRRRLRALARQLRGGPTYQRGNAAIIEAALADDRDLAVAKYAEAQACFTEVGAEAHRAAARVRWAALLDDDDGDDDGDKAALQASANAYFTAQAIRDPEGLALALAPAPTARAPSWPSW